MADYEAPYLEDETDAHREKRVYSVSDLNREARSVLEARFASIWVEAEVSNFKFHTSGHMYLSLKDDKSQISAVFFSRWNQGIKFKIEDGMKVLVCGRISLYEPRGQYQFYIERMEPQGVGALELALRQLRARLEKEGLFDPGHKKRIPRFPAAVGVITSPTGAVIRDILNVVNRRFLGTRVLLYPVRVQGEGSAAEIARALEDMNHLEEPVDVLIVGRGGGSLEDLWSFNEEVVVRAVYASRIPVISAVGHETDWTLCDLAADLRAPTPSAAAELVVQNREEVASRVQDYTGRMMTSLSYLLENSRSRLEALENSYALKQPVFLVQQAAQRLDEAVRRLMMSGPSRVEDSARAFQMLAGKMQALSPLAILSRGYSVTQKQDGKLFKDLRELVPGTRMVTRFSFGTVESEVREARPTKGGRHGAG